MKLHELSPAPGSVKDSFRKGRGAGSGNGKTAGKGHKGQNARSGGGVRPGLRAVSSRSTVSFPREALQTKNSRPFTPTSTLRHLTFLKTEQSLTSTL